MAGLRDDVDIATGLQAYDRVPIGPNRPNGTGDMPDDHSPEVAADLVAQRRTDACIIVPSVELSIERRQAVGPVA